MRPAAFRVARTLQHQGMPLHEIRAVLRTDDPVVVRRYLELHRERLDEWVARQREDLRALERLVMPARDRA
jgi:DNA-binding transcriptional MerR regulator